MRPISPAASARAGRIVPAEVIAEGLSGSSGRSPARNAIPTAILTAGVEDPAVWQAEAWVTVGGLLGGWDGDADALSSC